MRVDGGQFKGGDVMYINRIDEFEFIVTFDEKEFRRIQVACDKWDESYEEVVEKIVEHGFDEGCEL